MANTFYNRVIRKLVVGFGNLFDNITLVRYNADNSEAERFIVPIAYAAKEDYVMRLENDYNLDKKVQMTLPRLSFQMNGMTYDPTRKQNTNVRQFTQSQGNVLAQYNPVPYNFDFSLFIYVRNIEDGTQLIEHILPFFTPDYTIKLNLIPEMGIIKEIPVILNNVDMPVDFEGNRERDTRIIIWTLNFTVKGFIFGGTSNVGLIEHSITNIYNEITPETQVQFTINGITGVGNYQQGETVYQGYSLGNATATAKVVLFSYGKLTLTNINGNFVSSMPIVGASTNANYLFTSYDFLSKKYVEIDVTPYPSDATANDNYTYTTTITEEPNGNVVIPVITSTDVDLNTGNKYIDLL